MIEVKEEKDIDSLFSGGRTTALTHTIKGLDDFELIAFLVIEGGGACGEQPSYQLQAVWKVGSSPRVRGTGAGRRRAAEGADVIPAGAGNRGLLSAWVSFHTGHPRGCGEQSPASRQPKALVGSSPRVRGTAQRRCRDTARWRVIPAGAGNRRRERCSVSGMSGHPRGCGEQVVAIVREKVSDGSSPRVRGTVHDDRGIQLGQRVIPAGAGNSCPRF